LCELWQATPSVRVARIVATLDANLPTRDLLDGKTVAARERSWVALADARDPTTLRDLLAVPWPVRATFAAARVDALAGWPRSPRISKALLEMPRRRLYNVRGDDGSMQFSLAGRALACRVFELLLDQHDPAASAYLDELRRAKPPAAPHEREVLAAALR